VDSTKLAKATPGFSGADIRNLVNLATIKATTRNLQEVTNECIEDARDDIIMGTWSAFWA